MSKLPSPSLLALCSIVVVLFLAACAATSTCSGDDETLELEGPRGLLAVGRNYTDLYEKAITDERTYVETVSTSLLGATIPRISGSISAISSLLIIVIILRSTVGMSTTYHRLIFGLSITDLFSSLAMALSTLPMPKDMIYTQFEGQHIGNTLTCTTQGFVFFYALRVTSGYNILLCVYYLCSIRYKMKEQHIRKRIEPWLHGAAILMPLPPAVLLLFTKNYNPSPISSWCGGTHYPWYCTATDEGDVNETCALRGGESALIVSYYAIVLLCAACLIFFTSMSLIALFVREQDRLLKLYYKSYSKASSDMDRSRISSAATNDDTRIQACANRHQFAKVIYKQALAYISAYLICQGSSVMINYNGSRMVSGHGLVIFHLVAYPLQGFFNLVIFVGHKVYNLRRIYPDISIVKLIGRVFNDRNEPQFIFTQISLVQNGNEVPEFDEVIDEDDGPNILEDGGNRIAAGVDVDVISYDDSRNEIFEEDANNSNTSGNFSGFSASRQSDNTSTGLSWIGTLSRLGEGESHDGSKPGP